MVRGPIPLTRVMASSVGYGPLASRSAITRADTTGPTPGKSCRVCASAAFTFTRPPSRTLAICAATRAEGGAGRTA